MKSSFNKRLVLALWVSLVCVSMDTARASMSWNWERPLPLGGSQVFAIWGTSRTDLWYGGVEGLLLHFDGKDWVRYDVGAAEIFQFSGTSSTDIWAIATLGHYPGPSVAFHWDGSSWTRSDVDARSGSMRCIWEADPDNVFAGGERGLFRWNGSTWSAMPSPAGYPENIWGTSRDDFWVSDLSGSSVHWNGSRWDEPQWASRSRVYVVTGTAPDDVWGYGAFGKIYHWDGRSWTTRFPWKERYWASIKAFARNDVWAFAINRAVYHFDGVAWSEVTAPSGPGYPDWFALWMESPSYATSVSQNGAIRTWNGRSWTVDEENRQRLNAVSGVGESLWAVGGYGTILRRDHGVWREEASGTRAHLNLVLATSSEDVWAAGWDRTLLHWNGREWESTTSPTEHRLLTLFASAPSRVGAISQGGELFEWDGSAWVLVSVAPLGHDPSAAWASSSSDVWVAEGSSCIREQCSAWLRHWDGQRWEGTQLGGRYFDIEAGWSSAANDVWLEDTQSLLHWDGLGWSSHPYTGYQRGFAFWGDRPDNVWHFGWGVLDHWDGSSWRAVPVITRNSFFGLWQSGSTVWLVGEYGMVLRGDEEPSGGSVTPNRPLNLAR